MTLPVRALLAALLLALLAPAAAQADVRLVVKREPGLSAAERADLRADAGVRLAESLPLPRVEVVTAPAGDANAALRALRADPDVTWAEPDAPMHAVSNDPDFPRQYGLTTMAALGAWGFGTGAGQTVAVVDTGVDLRHPDLAGQVAGGSNFLAPGTAPQDDNGHGTHVAGIVAAARDNGVGTSGVAPDARVLAYKALDAQGGGYTSTVAAAFAAAGDAGARVVSASLAGDTSSAALSDAIAQHPGTLFVVAAGNDGGDVDATPRYPCSYSYANVLCVGATDASDARAGFSNFGARSVDVYAPGVNIVSTALGGGTVSMSGTSMATPAVAGEAALVLGRVPDLTTAQLKDAIVAAVDQRSGLPSVSGGRADALLALRRVTSDMDGDGVLDARDDCPALANPAQADADADGAGDACDPTPRGADLDGDGVGALDDRCPAQAGNVAGCPDSDGDGRLDSQDACPAERASTANGCPIPALRLLRIRVSRARRATVTVAADRAAAAAVTVQRRAGSRWVTAARLKIAAAPAARSAAVGRRALVRGTYRMTVVVSSAAGAAPAATKSFRVR